MDARTFNLSKELQLTISPDRAETARGCQAMVAATLPPSELNVKLTILFALLAFASYSVVPSAPATAVV